MSFNHFTDEARRAVGLASQYARTLNHGYVGPEHVLLGCTAESRGVAHAALSALGLDPDTVRASVVAAAGLGPKPARGHIPFTSRGKRVLERALRESLMLDHDWIGTEHLLLALASDPGEVVIKVLADAELLPHDLQEKVLALLPFTAPEPPTRIPVVSSPELTEVMRDVRAILAAIAKHMGAEVGRDQP